MLPDLDAVAVTGYRKSRVVFGLPEYRILKQSFSQQFVGPKMATLTGMPAGPSLNVALLPSGSWCIASYEMQMQFERSECSGNMIPPVGTTPPVGSFTSDIERFASISQLPGVTYDSSVVVLGSYWARKRIPAGGSWHNELSTDVGILPQPNLPTTNAPMRRIASLSAASVVNRSFYLRFYGPGGPLATQDALLTFYFGGAVPTNWPNGMSTPAGGSFAVTLFGDGWAVLWESTYTSSPYWRPVDRFRWQVPGKIPNQQQVIIFIPEALDTLNIVGTGIPHVFASTSKNAGYSFKFGVTGASNFRLDMREDLRLPFQFGYCTFPPGTPLGGTLTAPHGAGITGTPFRIPYRLAAGAKIIPRLKQTVGPGGISPRTVAVEIWDASTLTPLPGPAGDGSFSTVIPSQRDYFPFYKFSTTDPQFTPFLRSCEFHVDGVTEITAPTSYTGGKLMEVAITGPDIGIDFETANLLIEDDRAELADGPALPSVEKGLDTHAETHLQVQTTYDRADQTKQWVLFDGYLTRAAALKQGKDLGNPLQYPSLRWSTMRIQAAGQWYRLRQDWQRAWDHPNYTEDDAAAVDPATGRPPPWTVNAIIANLLKSAGYDDTQIHLTDPPGTTTPLRLFANGKDIEGYLLLPGVPIADAIEHLMSEYLGGMLIWDKEALPHGRWISVYPPPFSGSYDSLSRMTFRTRGPALSLGPAVPAHTGYAAGETFVADYSKWVTPPAANLFIVATCDPRAAKDDPAASNIAMAIGVNWRSTFFEGYPAPITGHLDFVPYGVKPSILIDPALYADGNVERAQEACRYVCRRQMMRGAYGVRHFQWLSPLMPYFDPDTVYAGGPRTLRTYDVVTFDEDGTLRSVLLTSCNPQIGKPEGDKCQWAQYEGFQIPDPLSY